MRDTNGTEVLRLSRLEDQSDAGMAPESQEDFSSAQFCGDWTTTNPESSGIARIIVAAHGDGLTVNAFGVLGSEQNDWGTVPAEVFMEGAGSSRVRAFRAFYDFGFMETHLQAKTEKGVLVIASFNKFKDQSQRAHYFSREFFYCTSRD
jgi:hypothetical protein